MQSLGYECVGGAPWPNAGARERKVEWQKREVDRGQDLRTGVSYKSCVTLEAIQVCPCRNSAAIGDHTRPIDVSLFQKCRLRRFQSPIRGRWCQWQNTHRFP